MDKNLESQFNRHLWPFFLTISHLLRIEAAFLGPIPRGQKCPGASTAAQTTTSLEFVVESEGSLYETKNIACKSRNLSFEVSREEEEELW